MFRDLREMVRRLVHWRLLVPTAVVTAIWTWTVVLRGGYATSDMPFAWLQARSCRASIPHYDILVLDIAIWFVLFYWMVRGFTLMQRSPFRRPFRRPPHPPDWR